MATFRPPRPPAAAGSGHNNDLRDSRPRAISAEARDSAPSLVPAPAVSGSGDGHRLQRSRSHESSGHIGAEKAMPGASKAGEDTASVDDLRERLAGVVRRLAKEGVRVSALEAQLREEKSKSAELTAELAAARSVPRPGAVPRAHQMGQDLLERMPSAEDLGPAGKRHCAGTELSDRQQPPMQKVASSPSGCSDRAIQTSERMRLEVTEQVEAQERQRADGRLAEELQRCEKRLEEQEQAALQEAISAGEHRASAALEAAEGRGQELHAELSLQEKLGQQEFQQEQAACEHQRQCARSATKMSEHAEQLVLELRAQGARFQEEVASMKAFSDRRLEEVDREAEAACDRRFLEAREHLESELCEQGRLAEAQAIESLRAQIAEEIQASERAHSDSLHCELSRQRETLSAELAVQSITLQAEEAASSKHLRQLSQQEDERRALSAEVSELRGTLSAQKVGTSEQRELDAARIRDLQVQLVAEEEIQQEAVKQAQAEGAAAATAARRTAEEAAEELSDRRVQDALSEQLLQFRLERRQLQESHEAQLASEALECQKRASESAKAFSAETTRLREQLEIRSQEPAAHSAAAVAAENARLHSQLDSRSAALADAEQVQIELKSELERVKKAGFAVAQGKSEDTRQAEELQQLLQLAYDENRELRERVAQQQEEISLLESRVLGALDDIRDDGNTRRRWGLGQGASLAGAGQQSQNGNVGRASSVPSRSPEPLPNRALAGVSSAGSQQVSRVGSRSTPPRRPGDIRRGQSQPKSGSEGSSIGSFLKL